MSSKDSTNTLIATAVTAAAAGAAITYTALKYQSSSSSNNNDDRQKNRTAAAREDSPPPKSSLIYDNSTAGDPNSSSIAKSGSNTVLFPHNHEEKMRRRIAARVSVEEENLTPRNSVTVRVPASSANVGPGYDCIGIAVDLWSEITVTRADKFEITAEGEGAAEMPKDESNLMVVGLQAAFKAANKPVPILKYHAVSRVPYARGLGSSSAAIVAGIVAGLVMAGHRLPCWGSEALLQIAASIEGHPDNVAPVIYGGIQIGIHNGTRWVTERAPHPSGMQAVLFIPDFIGKTSDARGVLGSTVTRQEAAFNIGRAAFLVHALCTGNLDNLKWGVEDKLHQPQRGKALYPYLFPMIEAAEKAGASCAYLSGAGPTVMALTSGASGDIFTQREKERTDSAVAKAMLQVADAYGIKGQLLVTQPVHEGARVIKVDPPFSSDTITYRDNI
jgi:homoserine kinase